VEHFDLFSNIWLDCGYVMCIPKVDPCMGPTLVAEKGIGFFKLTSIRKIVFMALSAEYICCKVGIITPTSYKLHIDMSILAGLVIHIVGDPICYSLLNEAEFTSLFD
jgi:hypothetical protein